MSTVTPPGPSTGLDEEIVGSLHAVRSAYAAFLAALPTPTTRAIDVERALSVDKKLAWQVYRIAHDSDPLVAGTKIPGSAATQRLIKAGKKQGIPVEITTRVGETTEAFRKVMSRHAGDRASFDLMVSAVTGDGLDARNQDLKRTAFRTNSQLHGKQCEADVFTMIARPGERPDSVSLCSVRGLVKLCPLRPVARLEIARHRFDHAKGMVQEREAIEPSSGYTPIALLAPFCSQPLPTIREVEGADGFVRSLVETEHLGQSSAVTCFLADIVRDSPLRGAGDEPKAIGHIHEVATPSRVLFHDVLIHESMAVDPAVRVLANRRDAGSWPGDDDTSLLPIPEAVHKIGRGASAVTTPAVPDYPEMIEHVMRQLDWDPEEFVLYRTCIEYPVLDSVVWMRFDLDQS
jgi:hypothetical protein